MSSYWGPLIFVTIEYNSIGLTAKITAKAAKKSSELTRIAIMVLPFRRKNEYSMIGYAVNMNAPTIQELYKVTK